MKKLFIELLAASICGVMGFFFAGAVFLPIMADYLGRVALTLGAMAVVSGGESVLRLGHVQSCSISFNGNECKEHDLVTPALIMWAFFYALWRIREWTKTPPNSTLSNTSKTLDKPLITLGKPQIIFGKPTCAIMASACGLLFLGWMMLNPTVLSQTSYGWLIYPSRLVLTLALGLLMYLIASQRMVGTAQQLAVQLAFSAALGFFVTGLLHPLHAWAPPLDSPIDALFSLVITTIPAGFHSVLYLGNAANALIPAFLLWAAIFSWQRWRLKTRFTFAATQPGK